jgi:hypothetical protein
MTRIIVLAALALCAISPLGAQTPELATGSRVRVRTTGTDVRTVKGTVVASLGDTLAIADEDGRVLRLPVAGLSSIERSLGVSRSAGAGRGALWGAGVMFPLAVAGYYGMRCESGESYGWFCGDGLALGVGAGVMVLGAGVGALVGTTVGVERWEVLNRPAHIAIAPTRGGVRAGIHVQF